MAKKKWEQISPEKIEQEITPEENAFRSVIKNEMIELYAQELESAAAKPQAINEFKHLLSDIDDWDEFSGMVSWPFAIRQGLMKQLARLSGPEIVAALRDRLVLFGQYDRPQPKIGFHTTGEEIKPKKNSKGQLVWDIKGREASDLAEGNLAYAADCFAGLYHEKESDNFYVVRIMDDEGKYDADQGWHQVPIFSIVAKFDTENIYQKVDEELAKSEKSESIAA